MQVRGINLKELDIFCIDTKLSSADMPVFNRIVNLKDTWTKVQSKEN